MTAFLDESAAILGRTPDVLDALLRNVPDNWIHANDGPGTWSAYEVVGHLIHGERTDWIPRLEVILTHGPTRPFERFDREAQLRLSKDRSLNDLLDEFRNLRSANLEHLAKLTDEQLALPGTHPDLGPVTLRQLVATWTAHDLAHLTQITRTMARRYRSEVGPWAEYLSVMQRV